MILHFMASLICQRSLENNCLSEFKTRCGAGCPRRKTMSYLTASAALKHEVLWVHEPVKEVAWLICEIQRRQMGDGEVGVH